MRSLLIVGIILCFQGLIAQGKIENKIKTNKTKISQLESTIKQIKSSLFNFENEKRKWNEQLSYLKRSATSLHKEAKKTKKKIRELNQTIAYQQKKITVNQLKFSNYIHILRQQILKKHKIQLILDSSFLPNLKFLQNYNRNIYLLNKLVKSSSSISDQLIQDAESLKNKNIILLEKLEELQELELQQKETIDDLEYNRVEQTLLLDKINAQIDQQESTLASAQSELNQVTNLLYKLLIDKKKEKKEVILAGCQDQRNKFLKPAHATIIEKFQNKNQLQSKHAKGILLKPKNSQVVAALEGKIVYNGPLKGFNFVVVIDHGKTCYTVYGYLTKLLKRKDQFINKGTVLGEIDLKNPNAIFYFEIRNNGRPLNPNQWIKKPNWS